jgi:hypothetical protein
MDQTLSYTNYIYWNVIKAMEIKTFGTNVNIWQP